MTVPEGWKGKRLGEIVHLKKGITYKSSDYCTESEGIPFLTIKSVKRNGGYSPEGVKYYGGKYKEINLLSVGDIAIAVTDITRDGDIIGAPFALPESFRDQHVALSMDLHRLDIASSDLDTRYLYWFLLGRGARSHMKSMSAGSTVLHLNTRGALCLHVLLPPLPEQKKIAAILSSVDETIQATRETIEQTKKVKQGLMQELLTRGIGHTRFKKTEIGEIPEEWEAIKLGDLGSEDRPAVKAGPFGSALKKEFYVTSGYRVYGQEQVIAQDLSIGDYYINDEKFAELESCAVFPGDILVSLVGTPGKALVVPTNAEPGIINPRLVRISLASRVLPKFVGCMFDSKLIQNEIRNSSHGGTMPIVNGRIISNLRIPVPSFEEQEEIVRLISSISNRLHSEKDNLKQLECLKKGLMQDLLTGKVRVAV